MVLTIASAWAVFTSLNMLDAYIGFKIMKLKQTVGGVSVPVCSNQ